MRKFKLNGSFQNSEDLLSRDQIKKILGGSVDHHGTACECWNRESSDTKVVQCAPTATIQGCCGDGWEGMNCRG